MRTDTAMRRIGDLRLATIIETGFTVLVMYMLSEGPVAPSLIPPQGSTVADAPTAMAATNVILFGPIYVILVIMLLKHARSSWQTATADVLLVLLLGLMLASTAWSTAPDITLRRALGVIGTTLFAVYITRRYPTEKWIALLGWALGMNVLCNLLILMAHPGLAGTGEFNGVFSHKNTLGRMMALSGIVLVLISWMRRSMRALVCAGIATVVLLAAGSATALVVLVTVLSVIPLLKTLGKDVRAVVVIGVFAILGIATALMYGASNPQGAAAIVGKDVTLTGRTVLWHVLLGMIRERPVLGYGYNAFWSQEYAAGISVGGWMPTQAHNGYIDLSLDLGLVGVATFILAIIRGAFRAVRHFRREGTPASLWPLMFLCFLALYNMSESTNLAPQSLFWMLFSAALMTVAPAVARRNRRGAAELIYPRPDAEHIGASAVPSETVGGARGPRLARARGGSTGEHLQ
jgi:exopolysaccharide production protein ExoQ